MEDGEKNNFSSEKKNKTEIYFYGKCAAIESALVVHPVPAFEKKRKKSKCNEARLLLLLLLFIPLLFKAACVFAVT